MEQHWELSKQLQEEVWGHIFSHRSRSVETDLKLSGRIIPFVNRAKYRNAIIYREIPWTLHLATIKANASEYLLEFIPFQKWAIMRKN